MNEAFASRSGREGGDAVFDFAGAGIVGIEDVGDAETAPGSDE